MWGNPPCLSPPFPSPAPVGGQQTTRRHGFPGTANRSRSGTRKQTRAWWTMILFIRRSLPRRLGMLGAYCEHTRIVLHWKDDTSSCLTLIRCSGASARREEYAGLAVKKQKSPANWVIPSWFAVWGWIPWTCTRWIWGWRRRGWLQCRRRPACWLRSRRRPRWLCQMGRPRPFWWK